MAGSPFDVFRRNQRQLLVVLTGMAMFAFIFMDSVSMRTGEMPRSLNVVLIAGICAAGMWFVGNPRGKGSELALYGALIGGVIAFFGLRASGQQPVAVTEIGNFTREDLIEIAQRRQQANQFVQLASKGTNGGFAQIIDREHIRLRVWERGAGLTKACGTGACAALVCAARAGLTERTAKLILDGGELIIDWRESDDHVYMTGPVELEFETVI